LALYVELVQVAIGPTHRRLNDTVQVCQRHVAWHAKLAPYFGLTALQHHQQLVGVFLSTVFTWWFFQLRLALGGF
jgi:hypothetical protein